MSFHCFTYHHHQLSLDTIFQRPQYWCHSKEPGDTSAPIDPHSTALVAALPQNILSLLVCNMVPAKPDQKEDMLLVVSCWAGMMVVPMRKICVSSIAYTTHLLENWKCDVIIIYIMPLLNQKC